jgi:hypothetical protein
MKTMATDAQAGFIRNQATEKQGSVRNPSIDGIDAGVLLRRSMG